MPDTTERPEVTLRRYARAISALQAKHAPVQIYEGADGCDHPEPTGPTESADDDGWSKLDQWLEDHPMGEDAGGEAARLCLLTPRHASCRACTELVYGHRGDDDHFVDASDCIVLPVIEKALNEEITND